MLGGLTRTYLMLPEPVSRSNGYLLFGGDALEILAELPDASVHAVVTDPPYGLEFMGKEWDSFGKEPRTDKRGVIDPAEWGGAQDPGGGTAYSRSRVRTGAAHYGGDAAAVGRAFGEWCEQWAAQCLRILKPGGHLLAFGGSRTYHRLACAVEDAGFEIRDSITWLYGSGFPKSMDVAKALDKAAGRERTMRVNERWAERYPNGPGGNLSGDDRSEHYSQAKRIVGNPLMTSDPVSEEAQRWAGWGTALKPCGETIVVARKPLDGTVAHNVTEHGTGALNIDASRVPADAKLRAWSDRYGNTDGYADGNEFLAGGLSSRTGSTPPAGRWPANVVLSHTPECEQIGTRQVKNRAGSINDAGPRDNAVYGKDERPRGDWTAYGDADGNEEVPAFQCVPGCPVAELDQQSGKVKSTGTPDRPAQPTTYSNSGGYGGQLGLNAQGPLYSDEGGASRFFKTFRYGESEWCGDEYPRVESTSAGKSTENRSDNSHTDGIGSTPTDPSLKDSRSTTRITTPLTTTSTTSCVSQQSGTTTTTSESVSSTAGSKVLKNDVASDALSGSLSTNSTSDEVEPGRVTADPASVPTVESGSDSIATSSTPPVVTGVPEDYLPDLPTFRYQAKAPKKERPKVDGVSHATVKPLALMRWLVRLVTPPGGVVLEPFAGSGTTIEACRLEGFKCIAVEAESDYHPLIAARMEPHNKTWAKPVPPDEQVTEVT